MKCSNCKCNSCGHVNECELLVERFEYIDKTQESCIPILECSEYSVIKDTVRFNTWECLIKNTLGGD